MTNDTQLEFYGPLQPQSGLNPDRNSQISTNNLTIFGQFEYIRHLVLYWRQQLEVRGDLLGGAWEGTRHRCFLSLPEKASNDP